MNLEDMLVHGQFVSVGSTRKTYRYKDVVIKQFLHPLGHMQGKKEQEIFEILKIFNLVDHVAPVLHITEEFMMQPYYENLPRIDECTYNLNLETDERITTDLKEALKIIDEQLDGFDLKDSGNFGLNRNGELVLIDYGMTKKMYETQWVPLAETGVLPQIIVDTCSSCYKVKEIRTYGANDTEKRCIACGKI